MTFAPVTFAPVTRVASIRDEGDRKLADERAELRQALERQRIELAGSAEERLTMRMAEERNRRVSLLYRQGLRKMASLAVARAFGKWMRFWAARLRALHIIRQAALMFKAPGMASAFMVWVQQWRVARGVEHAAAATLARAEMLEKETLRLRREVSRSARTAERHPAPSRPWHDCLSTVPIDSPHRHSAPIDSPHRHSAPIDSPHRHSAPIDSPPLSRSSCDRWRDSRRAWPLHRASEPLSLSV